MNKVLSSVMLLLGTSVALLAQAGVPVPEIDSSTGVSALVLVAGAVLVFQTRRRK